MRSSLECTAALHVKRGVSRRSFLKGHGRAQPIGRDNGTARAQRSPTYEA